MLIRWTQVYLVDIRGGDKPTELTSGKHGATHSPVLSKQGDKAAWLQLDKDGAEADRSVQYAHPCFCILTHCAGLRSSSTT